jgi:hypothetical protein
VADPKALLIKRSRRPDSNRRPEEQRGHYIAEGIAWIRGHDQNVTREGRKDKLVD